MEPFGFVCPKQTLFGRGCRGKVASYVAGLASRVVLVRSASVGWADQLNSELQSAGLATFEVVSRGEPTLDYLEETLDLLRGFQPDCVISVGGGATIDLGKALAALLPSEDHALAHLEVIGQGKPLGADPVPFVAVPTTAGTGAEATKNAVITAPYATIKVSLRDVRMVPDLAVVDPALLDETPRPLTLATGLDAITQLIESYLSIRANTITDALCRDGISTGIAALKRLMEQERPADRDAMARASYLSGLALANAGLGVVHGLAAVIGGRGGAHGAICGRLLPAALEVNERVALSQGHGAERFRQVDDWLKHGLGEEALSGAAALRGLMERNGLPGLEALGCPQSAYREVASQALEASSTKGNPVRLDVEAVRMILEQS